MAKGKEILTDGRLAILLVIVILIIDQVIKIEVKTSMSLGEAIHVTDWFYIDFVENNGMAYGMTFINKLVLSILRLVAITVIARYIWKVVKQGMRTRYIVFLSMILAGAVGNMIDSMFYGLIFNASTPFTVASFVPFGTGYADFLTGKVVDMFYFPLIVTTYPECFPFKGGEQFIFFCSFAERSWKPYRSAFLGRKKTLTRRKGDCCENNCWYIHVHFALAYHYRL